MTERMEADLAGLLHPSSGYSHAENILVALRAHEEAGMPHKQAVEALWTEFVGKLSDR